VSELHLGPVVSIGNLALPQRAGTPCNLGDVCVVGVQVVARVRQGRLQNLFTLPARYPGMQVRSASRNVFRATCIM
jgi:hypothetical protein